MSLLPPPSVMHPFCVDSCGLTFIRFNIILASATSAVWPTGSQAFFIPFTLNVPAIATQMAVYNGATVSGNLDVGIYDQAGTRLVSSGSTAQAGTNAAQAMNITDTLIGPGLFYMALVLDNTTATVFRVTQSGTVMGTTIGMYKQTSAFALPATATFATNDVNTYIPVFGVIFNSAVF